MKPGGAIYWLVLCCCGSAYRASTAGGADRTAEWHRENGAEGADHVTSIEYRDPRCQGPPRGQAAP